MKRIFILAALTLLIAAPAWAVPSDALIRHVPKSAQLVVGLEVPKLKKSFLFDEVMKVIKDQASGKSILTFVINSKSFDFENDVESMLVAFEKPMTNPNATSAPASAVVLSGKLDAAKVKAAAEKHFGKLKATKKGALEVLSASGLDMAFVDTSTLVIVDQGAFGDATWKAIGDETQSGTKNGELKDMMGLVDTKRGVWVAILTKGAVAAPGAPPMDGAAMALEVGPGVKVDFRSKFEKGEDAKKALTQFQDMKKQSGQDPLIAMLGAKPLMDNLKAGVEKERVLAMSTSMTEAELKAMFTRLKAMNQAPPPMQTPPPTGATGQPAPNQSTPQPAGEGVKADFN